MVGFRYFQVVLSVVESQRLGQPSAFLSAIGWALSAFGFLVACVVSVRMGWSNAHGDAVALRTDGLFSYSGNYSISNAKKCSSQIMSDLSAWILCVGID